MRLGIGTVQFGMTYGVNEAPATGAQEVERMVAFAAKRGITVWDTAPLYGNSEAVLGAHLLADAPVQLVTKTPRFAADVLTPNDGVVLRETLLQSLSHLRRDQVHTLLIHHAPDLLKPGAQYLVEAMKTLQAEGKVGCIGVSVYHPHDVDAIFQKWPLQAVQLPLNVADQRFIQAGTLVFLESINVKIYARSVFLQSVLLLEPDDLPEYFAPVRAHYQRYHRVLADCNCTPLEAALGFARMQSEAITWIVGGNTCAHLEAIVAASCVPLTPFDYSPWAIEDEAMILPYLWKTS